MTTARLPKVPKSMGDAIDVDSFRRVFEGIKDPRIARTQLHPLSSVLFLCLCAVISGADTIVAIERYGHSKRELLEKFLPFPNGIPSHDTICRVLAKLNPIELERLFAEWMKEVAKLSTEGIVAIDGKTLRRAWDKKCGGEFVHMISAFASANQLVLGQVRTDTKSNEITAIPHLLDLIALRGCIVTIDAIGCQSAIADKIIEKGGDYLLAVKENQPELAAALRASFDEADGNPKASERRDFHESQEFHHGREEVRRCTVLEVTAGIEVPSRWSAVKTILRVETERTLRGKTEMATRLYVCSRALSANQGQAAVRGHWSIENGLHWVLDVAFREDDSRVRSENAAECFAVIRHIALNLLRSAPSKVGIKTRRLEAACNDKFLMTVLASLTN